MKQNLTSAERLRENARANGTLPNVRAYYRQIGWERDAPDRIPAEDLWVQGGRDHETQSGTVRLADVC